MGRLAFARFAARAPVTDKRPSPLPSFFTCLGSQSHNYQAKPPQMTHLVLPLKFDQSAGAALGLRERPNDTA